MNELIESLAALLERGIVVEPTTNTQFGPVGFRIRLADDDDQSADQIIKTAGEKGLTW